MARLKPCRCYETRALFSEQGEDESGSEDQQGLKPTLFIAVVYGPAEAVPLLQSKAPSTKLGEIEATRFLEARKTQLSAKHH
jgi:hypothetical protein